MRHGLKLISGASAVLLSLALTGQVAIAQAPADPAGGAKAQRRAELMKKFDKNGDGKLDDTERAALHAAEKERIQARKASLEKRKAELLKKFDQNGDGKLDPNERAAARSAVKKVRTPSAENPQSAQAIQKKIKDLQGQIKTEEQKLHKMNEKSKQRHAALLKKFDKNGDGKLDPEERAAMKTAKKSPPTTPAAKAF